MENKIGLKLWSLNENYIKPARELFKEKIYDYIELYAVPSSLEKLSLWVNLQKELNLPFAVHAPHFSHGLDFSNKDKRELNLAMAKEAFKWSEALNAIYTVFHPGIGGSLEESIYQIANLSRLLKNEFIIENKPFIVNFKKTGKTGFCVGSSYESLKRIKEETGVGLCLDIGHAICSANYQKLEIYGYVELLNSLKPRVYHLSDNAADSVQDAHLHFGEGSFNLAKIAKILNPALPLAIETNKNSEENLDDFRQDAEFFRRLR